ncbi:MAG: sigma-70 family RNA polymerase sigma factor [Chthoniobacteraceae bacterium]
MDDLIGQYRYPLYAYIRRRGFAHHDAEDALHDFLAKLLRLGALEAADAEQGRLRSYLCAALGRFLANWRRDEARRINGAGESVRDEADRDEVRYAKERFVDTDTPERIFERKWGHALMARVLARLEVRCEERGKRTLFFALNPVLQTGGSLRGHDAATIAAGLGMSEGALRVALNRHLHEYRAVIEEEVLQTVGSREEVAGEIDYLHSLFQGR